MVIRKCKEFCVELFNLKKFNTPLLTLLILTDLIFIIVHCLFIYSLNDFNNIFKIDKNILYSIENDQGYSEVFQYIKEFWIFLILLFLSVKKKGLTYFIWALLFLYLLLDDSLSIHEGLGKYLANYFDFHSRFNLRAVDFGELIVSFCVGISFFAFLSLAYFKANFEVKKVSQQLMVLLLFLVFFGIFVDMLHSLLQDDWKLGLIEDGGEMIAVSLITAYTFNLFRRDYNS